MTMTHASLFSGIGGFDLAAEWAGWTNAFNCEIDPFCRRILKYHFPNADQYADIRTTDFTIWRGRVDVLTGGFPCQPFSLAGKRKGTEDDRYLWPEMLRVIRTVRPRWIVGENVFGIVNWSEGVVFEQVCSDLEAAGYAVQPYIIPACGVGAPHRRDRCWFVAHARSDGGSEETEQQFGAHAQNNEQSEPLLGNGASANSANAGPKTMRERQDGVHAVEFVANASRYEDNRRRSRGFFAKPTGTNAQWNAPDTYCPRFSAISISCSADAQERSDENRRIVQHPGNDRRTLHTAPWENFPTQSPVCCRNDGISGGLDGITFPKWRNMSIKAYGNAIVPQVALQIFKTINEYDNHARKH